MLFSFYTLTWQESVIIAVSQFKENCPPGRGTSVESVSERSGGGAIKTCLFRVFLHIFSSAKVTKVHKSVGSGRATRFTATLTLT